MTRRNKKTQQYKTKKYTKVEKKIKRKTITSKSDYVSKASPNGPLNIYVAGLPRKT